MSEFRPVIGLEVHVQLATASKLFCGCRRAFGGEPNTRTCPVCLGMPGTLPVPNREAVRLGVRLAQLLGAVLSRRSGWARKNYFYPDLPKGYQITQGDEPLARGGRLRVELESGERCVVPVTRLHLEEDAGKLVHEGLGVSWSGVDFNRCGTPLAEIVFAPALEAPEAAQRALERLRALVQSAGVSDADMEKGSLRCDANVSLHRPGEALGTRVEIKNLNSMRHVRRALVAEIARQRALLEQGALVARETRSWDEAAGKTRTLRGKEDAEDYRYFPEPDLPPLVIDDALLAEALAGLPEPLERRFDRYAETLGLGDRTARELLVEVPVADVFDAVFAESGDARLAASWVLVELRGRLRERKESLETMRLDPRELGRLLAALREGALGAPAAKALLDAALETGRRPLELIDELGLRPLDDAEEIERLCAETLAAHPAQRDALQAGKRALFGFFVGQVLSACGGRADPRIVKEALRRQLGGERKG